MAQDALKAMIKKCESLDNVEMSVVRKKDKETLKGRVIHYHNPNKL
jgi:hypothetical protein